MKLTKRDKELLTYSVKVAVSKTGKTRMFLRRSRDSDTEDFTRLDAMEKELRKLLSKLEPSTEDCPSCGRKNVYVRDGFISEHTITPQGIRCTGSGLEVSKGKR